MAQRICRPKPRCPDCKTTAAVRKVHLSGIGEWYCFSCHVGIDLDGRRV